jgi:CheY-like chemotaxis protein
MSQPIKTPIVLHLEDDPQLGAAVATLLRTHGFEVFTVPDGPSALAWVARHPAGPDVLIIDILIPGEMDGAEVAQAICRCLGHVVPTILLSGALRSASLPWLPGAPLFCAHKPADADILVKVVETFAALGRFIGTHSRRFPPGP